MQKKLLALAVAGLISAPAMAQTNVQIYGTIDMGISHLGSGEGIDVGPTERPMEPAINGSPEPGASPRSRTAIDSGLHTANRIGLRGQEDLGNGLTGFFQVETGFAGDTSSALSGNRQALLGLRGDFGQVSLGRQWNPARQFVGNIDPFNNDSFGAAENFYVVQNRLDNSIVYNSPDFDGFQVDVAYTRNISGDEETRFSGQSRGDERMWAIVPTYEHGPLTVGLAYQRSDAGSNTGGTLFGLAGTPLAFGSDYNGFRQWDIGGAYDFGPVEVSALYGRHKWDVSNISDPEIRQWMIGASAPVGEAGTIKASYINSKLDVSNGSDPRAGKWSLGYDHALSARTNLYAVYTHVNTNSAGEGLYDAAQVGPRVETNDADVVTSAGAYESAFALGIRHSF